MKILVDADALPGSARDILFRAAQRTQINMILVANKPIRIPDSEFISFQLAEQGFDAADEMIVNITEPGDIAVTADIPLAAQIVEKGALAINPRGELYSEDNIKERLLMRDVLDVFRKVEEFTGGPRPYDKKAAQAFANQLDRLLTKYRQQH